MTTIMGPGLLSKSSLSRRPGPYTGRVVPSQVLNEWSDAVFSISDSDDSPVESPINEDAMVCVPQRCMSILELKY